MFICKKLNSEGLNIHFSVSQNYNVELPIAISFSYDKSDKSLKGKIKDALRTMKDDDFIQIDKGLSCKQESGYIIQCGNTSVLTPLFKAVANYNLVRAKHFKDNLGEDIIIVPTSIKELRLLGNIIKASDVKISTYDL